ncbi:MAG: TerB family tellurite resistance protein [Pseudomonadota bacterium]
MFKKIKSIFKDVHNTSTAFAADDHRTAIAALLVHVMAIDGLVSKSERTKLKSLLQNSFALSDEETTQLIAEAERQDNESVDLYNFTSLIKRSLDDAGRLRLIEMLWEMTLADGSIDEFENSIVKRIADLIGVEPRTRVHLRQKAQAAGND